MEQKKDFRRLIRCVFYWFTDWLGKNIEQFFILCYNSSLILQLIKFDINLYF